ncbi:MAG: hypothetical protein KDA88_03375 [Planctomycetaceae bacterium]|nr:hypothetical protein [Planctomycetaceae bacterium]MCB9952797.1 hypothetical protein [Planctomycetaceae bacterium]
MSLISRTLGISLANAKRLALTDFAEVAYGEPAAIAKALKEFTELGADVDYDYWPEGMSTDHWADELSNDGFHCKLCGGKLFFSIPGKTPGAECAQFNKMAKYPMSGGFGVFCPDCGNAITKYFGDPNLV